MRRLTFLFSFLLPILFPGRALAQGEPSPMSFDEFEAMEMPAPAKEAARAKRRVAIDFAEDQIEGELVVGPERIQTLLQLARLYHEAGRDEGDRAALDKAIGLYREVLALLPGELLRDHVTFFLGFALSSADRDEEGLRILLEVTEQWPDSTYTPHAWLHAGEIAFEAEIFDEALWLYQQAAGEDFELQGFAAYKLAWSFERTGQPDQARQAMVGVVQDPARPALSRAALEVLDFWTRRDLGRPADASYLTAIQQASRDQRPETPASRCQQRIPELKDRIADNPLAPDAPRLQFGIVACWIELGRLGPATTEIRRMETLYSRGSRWADTNNRHDRHAARELIRTAEQRVEEARGTPRR